MREFYPDHPDLDSLGVIDRLELLDLAGLIHWPCTSTIPRYKMYADMTLGLPMTDVITNHEPMRVRPGGRGSSDEVLVPEALLEIIISASSNPGDVVLDPFFGAAPTSVVAERLGRRWIAIASVPVSEAIRAKRVKPEEVTILESPLERTDLGDNHLTDSAAEMKDLLYDRQGGRCAGCEYELPRHLLVTDLVVKMDGKEQEEPDNLQLLCLHCRALRGRNSMDHLHVQLFRKGILTA